MQSSDGAPVQIEFPLADDVSRAAVANLAAKTRNSVRFLFRDGEQYEQAFSTLKPDCTIAAFSGDKVVGLLLIKRDGRDAFVITHEKFVELWGFARGTWLWLSYHAMQAFLDGPGTFCGAVWVHPDWRSRGIGVRLYQRLLDETDGEVQAVSRNPAVAFHKRMGFVPVRNPVRRALCFLVGGVPMKAPRRALRSVGHGAHHAHT